MAGDRVTLLCVTDSDAPSVPAIPEAAALVVEAVHSTELEVAIAKARSLGAVVVIGGEKSVDEILALGADEAVPAGSDAAAVATAVDCARSRAAVRIAEADGAAGHELAVLGLMGAAVAHEMNNPLAAATLNCGVLEDLVLPFAEAIDRMAQQASSAGQVTRSDLQRLLNLAEKQALVDIRDAIGDLSLALRSMRDVLRQMQALTQSDAPALCNLSSVLVEFATLVHHDVERVAEFTVEVPDYPCIVALGRARAISALSALIQNAMTAVADRRDGVIALRVGIDTGMVVVEVSDNGPGMRPDIRRQALNPFFTTRRPGALGLGLTFVAQHVRRAGGELLIDSEEGVGTTVRLFFPPASTVSAARVGKDEGSPN